MSSRKAPAAAQPSAKRAGGRGAKPAPHRASAAAVPVSAPDDLNGEALRLAAALDRVLAEGHADKVGPDAVQSLMAAVCRLYCLHIDAGASYPPLPGRTAVAPTDVMVACGALLRAADLQVFELGMWQSFTGR